MTTITLRSVKGSELTSSEVDANFQNLNNDKPEFEEGAWTPVISDGTNNATMSGSNAGRYSKSGSLVTVTATVETASLGSVSGSIRITGLPFVAGPSIGYRAGSAAGFGQGLSISAGTTVSLLISSNQDELQLFLWDVAGGTTAMQATEWSADGQIRLSFSYIAAS